MFLNTKTNKVITDVYDILFITTILGQLLAIQLQKKIKSNENDETVKMAKLKRSLIQKSRIVSDGKIKTNKNSIRKFDSSTNQTGFYSLTSKQQVQVAKVYLAALQNLRGGELDHLDAALAEQMRLEIELSRFLLEVVSHFVPELRKVHLWTQKVLTILANGERTGKLRKLVFKPTRILIELILSKSGIEIRYILKEATKATAYSLISQVPLTGPVVVIASTTGGVAGFCFAWAKASGGYTGVLLTVLSFLLRSVNQQYKFYQHLNQFDINEFSKLSTRDKLNYLVPFMDVEQVKPPIKATTIEMEATSALHNKFVPTFSQQKNSTDFLNGLFNNTTEGIVDDLTAKNFRNDTQSTDIVDALILNKLDSLKVPPE